MEPEQQRWNTQEPGPLVGLEQSFGHDPSCRELELSVVQIVLGELGALAAVQTVGSSHFEITAPSQINDVTLAAARDREFPHASSGHDPTTALETRTMVATCNEDSCLHQLTPRLVFIAGVLLLTGSEDAQAEADQQRGLPDIKGAVRAIMRARESSTQAHRAPHWEFTGALKLGRMDDRLCDQLRSMSPGLGAAAAPLLRDLHDGGRLLGLQAFRDTILTALKFMAEALRSSGPDSLFRGGRGGGPARQHDREVRAWRFSKIGWCSTL